MSRRLHSWFRRCEERPWSAHAPLYRGRGAPSGTPSMPAQNTVAGQYTYTPPAQNLPPSRTSQEEEDEAHRQEEEAHRQEDEYQMALALSLSAREGRLQSLSDQEEEELVRAKRDSLVPSTSSGAAQALSWNLVTTNCLNYDDIVCDGLYDVWGEFPEVQPGGIAKVFPSLDELRVIPFTPGDSREVVVVDHEHDSGLCTVDEVAAEAVSSAIKLGAVACVQALARVVVDSMGGPCSATEIAQVCWEHAQDLKHRRGSLVIPIGELQDFLASQNRRKDQDGQNEEVLKTLADACRLPCRVVRGQYYLGEGATGDSAIVTVLLNGVEYFVDLFSATGHIRPVAEEAARQLHNRGPSHPHQHQGGHQIQDGHQHQDGHQNQDGDHSRGLDWHGELDGPALLNLENSHSDATTAQESTEAQPASRHRYSPSIEDALDLADAQLRELRTTSDRFPVVSHAQPASLGDDSAPSVLPPGYPGSAVQAQLQQDAGSEAMSFGADRSVGSSSPQAPTVPGFSHSPIFYSASPFTPQPYLGKPPENKEMPSTSSIFERMLRGKAAGNPALGVPELATVPEAMPSPFSTEDAQQDHSEREHDSRGSLSGQFELLEKMYPYDPNNNSKSTVTPERPMYYPPPSSEEFLSAPSPFADPEVQLDHGHVLLPGAPRALYPDDEATEASAREEAPEASAGVPPLAEDHGGAVVRSDGVKDQIAQVGVRPSARRHSDSDVLLRYDWGRNAEAELRAPTAELAAAPNGTLAISPDQAADGGTGSAAGGGAQRPQTSDEWEIDPIEIRLGPRIGIGSFGEVYRGSWRHTDVAVKRLIDQELSPQLMEEFRAEVAIMKRLRHQNVVLFMGACTATPNLSIITQFVPRGSLFRLLHRTPNLVLDERRKLRMAIDVARGMHYLHSCRIVHRDLKSPNLLVDKDFTVKVCDFGLSRVRRSTLLSGKSQAGTPEWTAPEVLRSQAYDERADCYSYGVILWELLTNEEPWQDKTAMQVVGAVGWGNARLMIPDGTDPKMASLVLSCWGEPRGRPSFSDIIEYLQGCKDNVFHLPPRPDSPHVDEQPVFMSDAQHIADCKP